MRSSRRTVFAAPLVAVVAAPLTLTACGESRKPGTGSTGVTPPTPDRVVRWTVRHIGERCDADEWMNCPPDVRCNPPPTLTYACPPEMPPTAEVIQRRDGTCVIEKTGTPVPCPRHEPSIDAGVDAPVPAATKRSWTVSKTGAQCLAYDMQACPPPPGGQPAPPCNPPAPTTVSCDPFPSGRGQITETAPGTCIAWVTPNCPPNVPCNPPPPVPFPCPTS